MFSGHAYQLAGLIALLVVLLIAALMLMGLRARQAFQTAAKQLGLAWEQTEPFAPGECTGAIDGDVVRIFVEKVGRGSLERQLTAVEVDLVPPLETPFTIGKENVFTKVFRRAGVHDIEFDDKDFDDIYRITGPDPAAIRALFNKDVRAAMVILSKGSDDLQVRPEFIRWEKSGRVYDPKVLVRAAHAAVSAARGLRNG